MIVQMWLTGILFAVLIFLLLRYLRLKEKVRSEKEQIYKYMEAQQQQDSESVSLPEPIAELVDFIKQKTEDECKKETDDQEIRYKILQNQVNPHFLYNTLESIRSVAICDGADGIPQIAAMTKALASFFRYNISYSNNLVSLEEELENVNQYMFIQKFRFSDRFSMKINYECDRDAVSRIMLPKLVLQPIVENAIFHGLETRKGKGLIQINIIQVEHRIIIQVEDNGVGIPDKELFRLQENVNRRQFTELHGEDSGHNGVALWQINQQIRTLFGDQCGLRIYSTLGIGTMVEISLPAIKEEDQ